MQLFLFSGSPEAQAQRLMPLGKSCTTEPHPRLVQENITNLFIFNYVMYICAIGAQEPTKAGEEDQSYRQLQATTGLGIEPRSSC